MQDIFEAQRRHHPRVAQTTAAQRIAKLQHLHDTLLQYRSEIKAALWQDFRKNGFETDISELGIVNGEIRYTIRHLRSWMAVQPVGTPLVLFGTSSELRYEPKGVCLILSPWNFPFNLTLSPLVSAVAAGNCVIIKPSEYAPASAALMKKIVSECFPPEEVTLVEGGAETAQTLLGLPFNHVFFTGSPTVGKLVMAAAARQLSSVTLELGGKNPVVVDETANLDIAAEKIAWTRTMNAGQSCVSPDYVLVHDSVHNALVDKIGQRLDRFYGSSPEARLICPDYCRIINARNFSRIKGWLDEAVQRGAQIAYGGRTEEASCYIEPTVLTHIPEEATIWEEEVFGPVLSVRAYGDLSAALTFIRSKPVPLASYIFSSNKHNIRRFLAESRSGDTTVNDCEVHFFNPRLPFGGLNNSGIGSTHGHFGFLQFSHIRGVCRQNRWKPLTDLFHPPYGKKWLQKVLVEGVVKWF